VLRLGIPASRQRVALLAVLPESDKHANTIILDQSSRRPEKERFIVERLF
jgi:hypothetical protein